jgi:hypothetical protein
VAASPTLGFGVGQYLDGYLLSPEIFTMRIMAGDKYVISPELKIVYSHSGDDADDTEDLELELGLGVDIHRAIWKPEPNGLYAVLGPSVIYERHSYEYYSSFEPDSLRTRDEASQRYYLQLGLAMEYFLTHSLSVSVSTLSGLGLRFDKYEYKVDGQPRSSRDTSTWLIDLDSLDCVMFIIWYL